MSMKQDERTQHIHDEGNQPHHQDYDQYVDHVRFHQDMNTTNCDGEGNSYHHSPSARQDPANVANVKDGAPGHYHGERHGGGDSAHHDHAKENYSKPHHAPHSLKHSKGGRHK